MVLPWAITIAHQLLPSAPMAGLAKGTAAISMLVDLVFFGPPAIFLTWGWLYLSWPEHPRVCCWAAAAAFVSFWFVPSVAQGFVPLFIGLAMLAAIVEQAVAGRRAAADPSGAVRAV
jgi:hypothetical protein